MAHRLEKHYDDFIGVDTRSNLLTQNPKSARKGSKNFRFNYNDQLQKREGFQHKTSAGNSCEAGLIEYKYKDINTGASKTQILGVSFDGYLRKRYGHTLKITVAAGCAVRYYSFYYNGTNWVFELLNSSSAIIQSITVSLSMTLDSLRSAVAGFAITGLTVSVIDDDGNAVTSSLKAYLLDVKIAHEFLAASSSYDLNPVYDWTIVSTPDGVAPFQYCIKYAARSAPFDDEKVWESFEGISYVNANNSVYITDGGFPFKYDGRSIYRAGIPKTPMAAYSDLLYNGMQMTFVSGAGWTAGNHYFRLGIKYKDINGVVTLGKVQPLGVDFYQLGGGGMAPTGANVLLAGASGSLSIGPRSMQNGAQFPVYSCKTNGAQTVGATAGNYTLNVDSGHNIAVGMALRIDYTPIAVSQWTVSSNTGAYYAKVLAVTSTTIQVQIPVTLSHTISLYDNTCIQGCYVPDDMFGKSGDPSTSGIGSFDWYGAYYVLYATKASVDYTGVFYEAGAFPIPHNTNDEYSVRVETLDAALINPLDADGEDLPRACKYLSLWQNQIIQAGRPYDADTISAGLYPTLYNNGTTLLGPIYNNGALGCPTVKDLFYSTYSEAHLCDPQSIYWADPLNPEGFPQSGANEESFENSFNDSVTGMAQNKESFFVFKERTTAYLTGTLAEGSINKEFLEADVGSACMACIKEVRGAIIFMDQNMGFWSVVAGRLPVFMGYPLQEYFKANKVKPNLSQLSFKKAKADNFRVMDQYICYVPSGIEGDPGSDSVAFVFNYTSLESGSRNSWYVWQGFNAGGGVIANADGELLIAQNKSGDNRLLKQKFTGTKYDFSDHQTAVEFNYKGAFVNQGAPVIDKNYTRCVVNSVEGGFDLRIDQYGNYIDDVISDLNLTVPSLGSKLTVKVEAKSSAAKLSSTSWGFYNNTINQNVLINGWEIEYSASFDGGEEKR